MPEIIETETQEISVMSLNGDGTQENPYQITTVAEFRSMNDSNAYFKLMNDLDVNDSEWANGWTSVTLAFKEFDGDGHEIRNINYNGTTQAITISSANSTIKKLAFLNFISIGSLRCFNAPASGVTTFDMCNFSFDVNTDSFFGLGGTSSGVVFNRCSFTLSGVANDFDSIHRATSAMTNCHIYLVNFKLPDTLTGFHATSFIKLSSTRVSILGSAIKTGDGTMQLFGDCTQCFVALDMADSAYRPTAFSAQSLSTPCFYDKDLMGETLTAQTNVHALTTAQCKDKDYLNSIGFVVV